MEGRGMYKYLKRMKITLWVIFALSVLSMVGVLLFWIFMPDSTVNYQTYFIIIISINLGLALLSLLLGFFFVYKFDKVRKTSELQVSDIVGNDVGAAYDFGEIGLIICDDDGIILWENGLLLSRGINLVDSNISKLSEKLVALKESNGSSISYDDSLFSYKGKHYAARYLKDAHLFILKDESIYRNLLSYNDKHEAAIAYLTIDAYQDIQTSDDEEKAEINSSIREMVTNYFRSFGCLVKVIRADYFMIFLHKEKLEAMIEDKFSIVSKIEDYFKDNKDGDNSHAGSGTGLTCSLGIGYGDNSGFNNDDILARQALDIALSRGGNQTVVAPFGETMRVYGGGTNETQQTASSVKIKTFARVFLNQVENASNVLIVPHIQADMDAIGAALGVYSICKSIPRKKNIPVNIVYSNQDVEQSVDVALREILPDTKKINFFKDVFVSFQKSNELKGPKTLIVAVDHNRVAQAIYPNLFEGDVGNNIAVIDHHKKQPDSYALTEFEHIDYSASSTCELVALYFSAYSFRVDVPPYIATLMLSGIYLDTQNFKVKTRISTHEAAIALSQFGANETQARDFLKESFENFTVKSKIMANVDTYSYGVLIARAPEDEVIHPAILAMAANELTNIDSIRAVFAIGYVDANHTCYISARGNGRVNLELIMSKILGGGFGGGHFSQAAAKLPNMSIKQAEEELRHVLDEYLKDASEEIDEEY